MTDRRYAPTHWTLDSGSELYLNRTPSGDWSVDIFAWDSAKTDDPTYHAYYSGPDAETDARADAESWRKWPEGDAR